MIFKCSKTGSLSIMFPNKVSFSKVSLNDLFILIHCGSKFWSLYCVSVSHTGQVELKCRVHFRLTLAVVLFVRFTWINVNAPGVKDIKNAPESRLCDIPG